MFGNIKFYNSFLQSEVNRITGSLRPWDLTWRVGFVPFPAVAQRDYLSCASSPPAITGLRRGIRPHACRAKAFLTCPPFSVFFLHPLLTIIFVQSL